jgi:hypothetical protein
MCKHKALDSNFFFTKAIRLGDVVYKLHLNLFILDKFLYLFKIVACFERGGDRGK